VGEVCALLSAVLVDADAVRLWGNTLRSMTVSGGGAAG